MHSIIRRPHVRFLLKPYAGDDLLQALRELCPDRLFPREVLPSIG